MLSFFFKLLRSLKFCRRNYLNIFSWGNIFILGFIIFSTITLLRTGSATCNLASSLHRRLASSSVHLPQAGGPLCGYRIHSPGGKSHANSSHPSVLASQVAWITGEPILPANIYSAVYLSRPV